MLFIITATVILLLIIHWFYNEFFGYWKKRGVPHPRTLPMIGNLQPDITLTDMLSNCLQKAYKNYKNCLYVGFYQFQKPAILIRDLELIKTITTKGFTSFHDNQFYINRNGDPILGKNPYVLKGEEWKITRAQVTAGIASDKINNMCHLMSIVNKNLIDALNEEIKTNKPIDAKDLSGRYVTDIMASCFFGIKGNALNNPNSEFRKIARNLGATPFWKRFSFFILFTKPYLGYILKLSIIPKDTKKKFVEIFQNLIKYRETNNITVNDYLDHMISLKTKLGKHEFTNTDILSRSMTLLLSGLKATTLGLSFLLYELGQNFKVQSKLQEEIDNIMKTCKGEITYEDLQNMNYLDMVLSESLRKYPPFMFLNRMCTKEFTLPPAKGTGPNIILETGTPVTIPVYAIHMDPNYYPEPEKFIPERFTEEAKKSLPKYAYIPFGEGPRMCLGTRFALTQIKFALFSILANFDIKLNPRTTPFEIDVPTLFINKKGGIWLNFNKRVVLNP